MADLLSILSGASTGLAAQRTVTATASHNIENANTPGYARQTANLETLAPEQVNGVFIGRGVTVTSITQARDRFLEAQIPQAMGNAAYSAAESEALQAFHGLDVDAGGGLGSAISGFFTSLRALAQNANDPGLRASFFGAADAMARAFRSTAGSIESTRTGLDAQASALTGQITSEAQAVAQLNVQIGIAQGSGAAPNDLLDLRQKHLDKLAELAGARAIPTSGGAVDVALPDGTALVAGGKWASLTTAPNTTSGHLDVKIAFPAGATPSTLAASSLGGSLGGTLRARDVDLFDTLASVDQLATQLSDALNAQHARGDTPSGAPGGQVFDASGGAIAMTLLLSDPSKVATAGRGSGPGDATNANALLDLESKPLDPSDLGSKDPQATVSDIVAQFGSAASSAKAFADQDGAWNDRLTSLRESYSGVSIDEEMITLQKAQRGYEAIAKVLQTADQMLQTLMNLR